MTQTRRHSQAGRRTKLQAFLAGWALLLCCLAAAWPAAAGQITPGLSTGVGYDDNIHLQRNKRSDTFIQASPTLRVEMGKPTNRFDALAKADFVHYFDHSDLDSFENGSLAMGWRGEPSRNLSFDIRNYLVSTYDPAQLNQEGQLEQVRETDQRRVSNTLNASAQYAYAPMSYIWSGYSFSFNEVTTTDYYHKIEGGVAQKMGADYQVMASAGYAYDDFEESPDVQRVTGEGRLNRFMGPLHTAFVSLGAEVVRSRSSNQDVARARDYEIYSATVGLNSKPTRTLEWEVSAGASYVQGDSSENQAAGSVQPLFNARVRYNQQRWRAEAYAQATLREYDYLGEDSGLALSQRVGALARWELARHWGLMVSGDYIRDDYQQDDLGSTTGRQGLTQTYQAAVVLDYQWTKYISFSLDYRYLNIDAADNDDDRSQNRVVLLLNAAWPNRW